MEDLRIIKLVLYLLKGDSFLEINFQKNCLYSPRFVHLGLLLYKDLNCLPSCLALTYFDIPIYGRSLYYKDWLKLILTIKYQIISWKSKFLFIVRE